VRVFHPLSRRLCGAVTALVLVCAVPHAAWAGGMPQQDATAVTKALADADAALKARQYDEAVKCFKRASSAAKDQSPEALWGMAMAYSQLNAFKNVDTALDKYLPLVADDARKQAAAHNLKGQADWNAAMLNEDAKKIVEAETHFRKALELNPNLVVAYYNLGCMLLRQKNDADGIAQLNHYLELAPKGVYAAVSKKYIENPRRARENYAPEFSATTLEGERVSMEELLGKVVVLDFWATWCAPCEAALPTLKRQARRAGTDPLAVISVSTDSDKDKWRAYIKEHAMTWTQVFDAKGALSRAYNVDAMPTYLVIDHEGIIRGRLVGYSFGNDGAFEDLVNKWVKAAKAAAAQAK